MSPTFASIGGLGLDTALRLLDQHVADRGDPPADRLLPGLPPTERPDHPSTGGNNMLVE
ncbi:MULTISPECIES: hypothetical protein [unclassified Rathayibacter]|uniref:hypothetical protein n=1 Tax=unclassified Rathayibacter TaxID=2609250 RepID=UPI001612FD33|nr:MULTISPECIES: hypothetical protein [unclassified Rathayibacter]